MKTKNLFYRLSIYFLISTIFLSGIIILIGYYSARNLIIESNRYRLQFEVREVLDDVENSMDDASRFTRHLVLDFKQTIIQKDLPKYMSMVFVGQPNTYSFGIVTTKTSKESLKIPEYTLTIFEAKIKTETIGFHSANKKTNEWINKMIFQDKPEWSAPFYDPGIGARAIIYAYPFNYIYNGNPIHATLFCAVNLDKNLRNLNNQKMIKSGMAFLLNEKNVIVYHPDSSQTGYGIESVARYFGKSKFDLKATIASRNPGSQLINSSSMKIKRSVVIFWPIKTSNWFVIVIIPENLFISQLKRWLLILIPLILFIGSVLASVTIYKSLKLVSPISNLAIDSRKIVEEVGFDHEPNLYNAEILSDSNFIWRLSDNNGAYPLKDIEALTFNMEKIKDRLASYRKSTIQNSLDKKEMDKELNLARDITMKMVPTNFPAAEGRTDFDCFGRLIPAKIVGGDLFDLFLLDDNQLFLSITDTVGKGIPAAMYSVMTRTFLRSIANPITRLGKMMESLNNALTLVHDSDMFATVFLAKLDLITGELTYCNAGHPHPFLLRKDNREEALNTSQGIPVGIKGNIAYSENQLVLAQGESLITFTDGITEQSNKSGAFWGVEGLKNAAARLRHMPAQIIVNKTIDEFSHFRGNIEVHDDITPVVIKYKPDHEHS